jgi:hypothetical protein
MLCTCCATMCHAVLFRPIELPDGRPVQSYPLVVSHMMKLFDQLFKPQLL